MKKIILILLLFLILILETFGATEIKAQTNSVPNLSVNNLGEKILKVQNQNFNYPPEITPLTLMQPNGQRLYVLSTSWSWLCTSSDNILNSSVSSPLNLRPENCQLVTLPDVYDYIDKNNTTMHMKDPAVINPVSEMTKDWKRTYDGILSLHLINNQLVGVRHNEHVNHEYPPEWTGLGKSAIYQNTMQVGIPAVITSPTSPYKDASYGYFWPTGCRSGYNIPHNNSQGQPINAAGAYDQCWDSFSSFVSLIQINTSSGNWSPSSAIRPVDDSKIIDQGPIIWPDSNYKATYGGNGNYSRALDGIQWRSGGFYQPTSFVDGNYIYTYFKTGKYGGYCTGAARAPLSENGNAGTWKYYNRARNSFDIPTLPNGFTKENIRNYYDANTGYKSDCIVDENDNNISQPQYFNVAKVKGTFYYIAAEERSTPSTGDWKMGVRYSTDLVNWSPLQTLSSCTAGGNWGWGCGKYAYPTFLDKGATTNYEVDADEFYILGTHATATDTGYELNAMKLSLALSLKGDFNGDGQLDIKDVTAMLGKWTQPIVTLTETDLKYDLVGSDSKLTINDVVYLLGLWKTAVVK